jgi:DNA transposition AAA+ family ATPase
VAEAAFKMVSNAEYDPELHDRFLLWKDQTGKSVSVIAGMISRPGATVSQYINKGYRGNLKEVEKDIERLLSREEDLEFVGGAKAFVETEASRMICEVLAYCDMNQKMGVALAPSGSGKTETCKEYKRKHRGTILITSDIVTRSPRTILRRIVQQVGGIGRRTSTSEFLQALIERLKGSKRLIVVDDGHFISFEGIEALRKIHDGASVGICLLGQEMLYEQMKGGADSSYLFDQIYSRIAIKRDPRDIKVTKLDTVRIAETIVSRLPGECVDYCYEVAKSKGRYRKLANLLGAAKEIGRAYLRPIDLPLLQEAGRFLGRSHE